MRTVQYHDGGILFADSSESYEEGWYLFTPGEEPERVHFDLRGVPEEVLDSY